VAVGCFGGVTAILLTGEYELVLDAKNRLVIPAKIRSAMDAEEDGDGFYVLIGTDGNLELFTSRRFEEEAGRADSTLLPSADLQDYYRICFATASKVEWDKQGRVLLPDTAVRRAGLGKDVTLVGARDHLELWNRADWDNFVEGRLARVAELRARARESVHRDRGVDKP
jgi:MraZ protein